MWNVLLYDVIVRLSTASAALDQHLLRHHCLFSSAHRFVYVMFMREAYKCTGLCRNQTINMSLKTRHCPVPSCGKNNLCIAFLLIPTFGKSVLTLFLIKFQIASNWNSSIFCSLNFTAESFTNKAHFTFFFSKKIETKRRCCADYIRFDSNTALLCGRYCFVSFYRSFDRYLIIYAFLT